MAAPQGGHDLPAMEGDKAMIERRDFYINGAWVAPR